MFSYSIYERVSLHSHSLQDANMTMMILQYQSMNAIVVFALVLTRNIFGSFTASVDVCFQDLDNRILGQFILKLYNWNQTSC